jgi:hypothetical protein
MPENVKVLASRRAYEFHADDLRLSTLSMKPVQAQIQQLFQFQTTVMGQPLSTFGDVPPTYPPGVVFDMGAWPTPEGQLIPIRFLHFEQYRVVVDVAGPSSIITAIFDRLQRFLSELQAADGSPVIGKPEHLLDYSEITAHFSFPLEALIAPSLWNLFAKVAKKDAQDSGFSVIPMLVMQTALDNNNITALAGPSDPHAFTFALRAGTRPDEHIYLSSAPLDSDAHLAYLNELESCLQDTSDLSSQHS